MLMINEGNYIDYRYFDAYNIIPRYEFGHGLSYTTFNYTNLSIASPSTSLPTYPTGTPSVGGPPQDLWDTVVRISATINKHCPPGRRRGAAAVYRVPHGGEAAHAGNCVGLSVLRLRRGMR